MNKSLILNELFDLYKKLRDNDDIKAAVNTLKLIAQLQGFFYKTTDLNLADLSDVELNSLLNQLERNGYASEII